MNRTVEIAEKGSIGILDWSAGYISGLYYDFSFFHMHRYVNNLYSADILLL